MLAEQNICKQRSYFLILPNSMPFIINSVILSLQLDRDIGNHMNSMAQTQNNLRLVCCVAISLCLGWQRITFTLRAQVIIRHPKQSDILPHSTSDSGGVVIISWLLYPTSTANNVSYKILVAI